MGATLGVTLEVIFHQEPTLGVTLRVTLTVRTASLRNSSNFNRNFKVSSVAFESIVRLSTHALLIGFTSGVTLMQRVSVNWVVI